MGFFMNMTIFALKLVVILVLIMIIGYYIVGVVNITKRDDDN